MSSRHKWIINAMPPEEINIPSAYKIDRCEKCGCLLIHKWFGGLDYRKTYLMKGTESEIRPECNDKKNE